MKMPKKNLNVTDTTKLLFAIVVAAVVVLLIAAIVAAFFINPDRGNSMYTTFAPLLTALLAGMMWWRQRRGA